MKSIFICFCAFFICIKIHAQQLELFSQHKSDFKIQLSTHPRNCDKRAADLLSNYFEKVSGAKISIINSDDENLKNHLRIRTLNFPNNNTSLEYGFYKIEIDQNGIVISGDSSGLIYGVYSFMEKFFGCHYYAHDCVVIPKLNTLSIPVGYVEEYSPAIKFRVTHYGEAYNPDYAAWNKLSNMANKNSISENWGYWVHSLNKFISPEVYFESHSEYFSMRNGIRTRDQLCLSNKDVLKIVIDSLSAKIKRNPGPKFWSISQMDNYNFCECAECRKTDSIEQSNSGTYIHFVNEVAAAFPDKVISTLAYQFSRKAPKYVKPLPNVNIMLCTIECERNKPIATVTTPGGFYDDLKNWSALSRNIIVWDYVINFSNVCSPFPNLNVLQKNLQLFTRFGVTMDFEQGWPNAAGEMEELRCYLIAKLLWNPDVNIDSVQTDFLNAYYKKAAPYITNIITRMHDELQKSGNVLTIYEHPFAHKNDYLSPANFSYYKQQYALAVKADKDTAVQNRIERFYQPYRYAEIEVAKAMVHTNDWLFEKDVNGSYKVKPYFDKLLLEFRDKANLYGLISVNERTYSPDDYYTSTKKYFDTGVENHLAVGATIKFDTMYADQYKADGINTLIDGIHGFDKYETLWQGWWGKDVIATIDLGNAKEIHQLQITCFDDNQSWIMAPKNVKFESSTDGITFTEQGIVENKNAGAKIDKQIVPFTLNLKQPINIRYIKVTVKAIGKLPLWRGVDGNAWTFADEIVIK